MKKTLVLLSVMLAAALSGGCDAKEDPKPDKQEEDKFNLARAEESYAAMNKYLYNASLKTYTRSTATRGERAVGWTQALFWDISMNAYKRTGDEKYLDLMEELFEGGNASLRNFDWWDIREWNLYDDMMWWVVSFARAYEITDDAKYLDLAISGFERVWYGDGENDALIINGYRDVGSWDEQRGGMRWDWKFDGTGKMACINFPTIIAAALLYDITGEQEYMTKAVKVYDWAWQNLVNRSTGQVYDSKHDGNQSADQTERLYNMATAMGACAHLYLSTGTQKYLDGALLIANRIKNEKTKNLYGVITPEYTGDDRNRDEMGVYFAIYAQYISLLIEECGRAEFIPLVRNCIEYGWKHRDVQRGLTTRNFSVPVETGSEITIYDACGIPALMWVCPFDE